MVLGSRAGNIVPDELGRPRVNISLVHLRRLAVACPGCSTLAIEDASEGVYQRWFSSRCLSYYCNMEATLIVLIFPFNFVKLSEIFALATMTDGRDLVHTRFRASASFWASLSRSSILWLCPVMVATRPATHVTQHRTPTTAPMKAASLK